MIRAVLLAGAMMLPALASADTLAGAGGRYTVDPSSRIGFTVGQVGGGGISGSFGQFSGVFDLDAKSVSRSKVQFTLKPASVNAGQTRVTDFLRSSAVFDVRNHPTVTFRSTRVAQSGARTAQIEGLLTARGVTRKETFTASLIGQSGRGITFHVTGDVYRSPYGMGVGTPIYSNVVRFDMTLQGRK